MPIFLALSPVFVSANRYSIMLRGWGGGKTGSKDQLVIPRCIQPSGIMR